MRNTFGNVLSLTLFGESHGSAIGGVLDGLASGIKVDMEYINSNMAKRHLANPFREGRKEPDCVNFLSGIYNGYTTGTPIAVVIENSDVNRKAYTKLKGIARPGHADYTNHIKYGGYEDYSGAGHSSGRITAPIVALGSVVLLALKNKGIEINTKIKSLGNVEIKDTDIIDEYGLNESARKLLLDNIPTGDSIGAILSTTVKGVPAGVGEPWFSSLEGEIAKACFSIPSVKAIEFGLGFSAGKTLGSINNDEFEIRDGKVRTKTNNSGGILGGISTGEDICFNVAVKPSPSIAIEQNTINFETMENTKVVVSGRHDETIGCKARVVIEAITAITIADMLMCKYGTDYLRG